MGGLRPATAGTTAVWPGLDWTRVGAPPAASPAPAAPSPAAVITRVASATALTGCPLAKRTRSARKSSAL